MQIRSIAMNVASPAAEQAIQKNGALTQPEGNVFGPSCSVTISWEGRSLSRQLQEAQGGQDTADVKEVRQQLRQLEKAEREKEEEEYGKKQKNAEETEKANEIAEEIERSWNDPSVDAELKEALREEAEEHFNFMWKIGWTRADENAGGAQTDRVLRFAKDQYKQCRQRMAEGYTITVLSYSDGVIDDRKFVHRGDSKTGKGRCEVVKDPEQVAGFMGGTIWKAGRISNASDIDWTKESIDTAVNVVRSLLMRDLMTPSKLERYSKEDLLERLDRHCEQLREELNEYLPPTGFVEFTDEEMAEYNKKLAASQIPLDEQQKKLEELAGRFTPDNPANVTRLDFGYSVTLPDMPES